MDIRTAVPADLDGIRRYDRHIPVTRLEDCIRRGLVDVLEENGRIVGMLRWNLFWQSLPFLDLIFLDDALRGQGWGTKMMSRWESNMAALGFDHVLLSPSPTRPPNSSTRSWATASAAPSSPRIRMWKS